MCILSSRKGGSILPSRKGYVSMNPKIGKGCGKQAVCNDEYSRDVKMEGTGVSRPRAPLDISKKEVENIRAGGSTQAPPKLDGLRSVLSRTNIGKKKIRL